MSELFTIQLLERSGTPLLLLGGELTTDGETPLVDTVQSVLSGPGEKIVFDFGHVKYINSGGISVLLSLISRSRNSGKAIVFCGLSKHLRKVIEIVGMTDFVTVCDVVDEALP